jgi:hypothetical protein
MKLPAADLSGQDKPGLSGSFRKSSPPQNTGPSSGEVPSKTVSSRTGSGPVSRSSIPATGTPVSQDKLKHLSAALGLPQDRLSASLISFLKYFSLPLDAGVIEKLRRQVLAAESLKRPGEPLSIGVEQGEKGLKTGEAGREALALGAAAAIDKGVKLTGEALGEYAAAMDPEKERLPWEEDPQEGGSGPETGENGGGSGQNKRRENKKTKNDKNHALPPEPRQDKVPEIEDIRKIYEKEEMKKELIGLLNKIPGKNGQRWIALPFRFFNQGVEFKVSIRILLKETGLFCQSGHLAVDIAGPFRRWLFTLDKPLKGGARLEAAVSPPLPRRDFQALERELQADLGALAEHISLRNSMEKTDFTTNSEIKHLPSVNEEV